jgi:hypothetical protein
LFYMNLRENVGARVEKFMQMNTTLVPAGE